MVRAEIQGVEFIAVNTDAQALLANDAPVRVQIGEKVAGGLGAGGDPERGRQAVEESLEDLQGVVGGSDMVFIVTGMGGGTGTGACPAIADLAMKSGALTIGIVTVPFAFEMARRQQVAEQGVNELSEKVDATIVIPNERLIDLTGDKVTVDNAFKMADDVLMTGIRTISEVITLHGLVNVDFADVKAIMKDAGPTWLSIGHGSGQDRVVDAARSAIASPLLDIPVEGATGVIYVVTGSTNLTLSEVSHAAGVIEAAVDPEANVIFGVTLDPKMDNDVMITLIATGFSDIKRVAQERREREFADLIKRLDEGELETPAYLRRPIALRRLSSRKT